MKAITVAQKLMEKHGDHGVPWLKVETNRTSNVLSEIVSIEHNLRLLVLNHENRQAAPIQNLFKEIRLAATRAERALKKEEAEPTPEATVETTPLYWDCECDEHYIHPKAVESCQRCDAEHHEMPDSRTSEVAIPENHSALV